MTFTSGPSCLIVIPFSRVVSLGLEPASLDFLTGISAKGLAFRAPLRLECSRSIPVHLPFHLGRNLHVQHHAKTCRGISRHVCLDFLWRRVHLCRPVFAQLRGSWPS